MLASCASSPSKYKRYMANRIQYCVALVGFESDIADPARVVQQMPTSTPLIGQSSQASPVASDLGGKSKNVRPRGMAAQLPHSD